MTLTIETTTKPNAEPAIVRIWRGIEDNLVEGTILDADAVTSVGVALREAGESLEQLGLDAREVEDLADRLDEAETIIRDVEATINGFLTREPADWPEASSIDAAMAAIDASIVAKLEAVLSENAALKARLAAFTQSDTAN
jgi:DNA repair ATPase RecN